MSNGSPGFPGASQSGLECSNSGQYEAETDLRQRFGRAAVWCVDRGFDSGVDRNFPADVDLESGVRGGGQRASRQEVSLSEDTGNVLLCGHRACPLLWTQGKGSLDGQYVLYLLFTNLGNQMFAM